MNMERRNALHEQIADEATDWFIRLREREAPRVDREQFALWLLRSPEHIAGYLAVTRAWGAVGQGPAFDVQALIDGALRAPAPAPNLIEFPARPPAARGVLPAERPMRRGGRIAAAVAACVVIGVAAGLAYDRWLNPDHIRTAIGELRTIALGDGSTLVLNTRSRARIAFNDGERRVRLLEGEAHFTVAPDASRPFIVGAHNASVQVLGTVFNVRALDGQTAVAVLEGRVAVSAQSVAEPGAYSLGAGERAIISARGEILPDTGPSLERASSWVQGQVTFADEPLTNIVAELNRYRETPIVIADPGIEALRVSGACHIEAQSQFLQYLETYRGVRAQPTRHGGYVLSRAGK